MATRLQEKLADEIIKDIKNPHPLNGGELTEKVGYARNTQKSPGRVLERKGVKEALAKRGFTLQEADNVVGTILRDRRIKPEARLNAADKIYKRLGAYAAEKHDIRELVVHIDSAVDAKYAAPSKTEGNS